MLFFFKTKKRVFIISFSSQLRLVSSWDSKDQCAYQPRLRNISRQRFQTFACWMNLIANPLVTYNLVLHLDMTSSPYSNDSGTD
mmetsp:Transcript_52113/g.60868  ORF Transcript_52113/g.60868 Transcript_52113/m.60868 type:complete len:84 (+) Transcript_52113:351-602(+)